MGGLWIYTFLISPPGCKTWCLNYSQPCIWRSIRGILCFPTWMQTLILLWLYRWMSENDCIRLKLWVFEDRHRIGFSTNISINSIVIELKFCNWSSGNSGMVHGWMFSKHSSVGWIICIIQKCYHRNLLFFHIIVTIIVQSTTVSLLSE